MRFASLTAFPDFAVEQTRGRKRINRLRPRLTMECYAVEQNKALYHAALHRRQMYREWFYTHTFKIAFYRVTKRAKAGKKQLDSYPPFFAPLYGRYPILVGC